MSFLSTFNLAASREAQCGYLTVEDVSAYPIGGYSIIQTARALFWSLDGFATVAGCDLNNPGSGEPAVWILPTTNNKTYTVLACLVVVWDPTAHIQFLENSITFYDGNWFRVKQALYSDGGTNPIAGALSNAYFEWLDSTHTCTDLYAHFNTAVIGGSVDPGLGYTNTYQKIDCPLFTVQKTDCHEYDIADNSGGETITAARLIQVDGTVIEDPIGSGAQFFTAGHIALTTPGDGAYIVEIEYGTAGLARLPIYDLCSSEACYSSLFREIYCDTTSPCSDPEGDCSGNETDQRYIDLLELEALMRSIREKTFDERSKFYYVLTASDKREEFIGEINLMIEKLKIITERCGHCNG